MPDYITASLHQYNGKIFDWRCHMEEKGMKKKKKLLRLFIETFYLSAFTFGGGYMIVSLMKKKFVNEYHWIEEDEMLDLVAIAQSAPGAIAVNGAIVVGYKLAGISGVIVSVFGAVLPPFLIISVVSVFMKYFGITGLLQRCFLVCRRVLVR